MIEIPGIVLITAFVVIIFLCLAVFKLKEDLEIEREINDEICNDVDKRVGVILERCEETDRLARSKVLNEQKYLNIISFLRVRAQATKIEIFYRDNNYLYCESSGLIVRFKNFQEFLDRVNYTMDLVEKDKSLNLMVHEAFGA